MSLNRPLNEGVVGAMLPQVGGLVSESVGLGVVWRDKMI